MDAKDATILLVEDDESVRKLLRKVMAQRGLDVIDVEYGGAALVECKRQEKKIDLMVTDSVMPDHTALAWIDRISELRPNMKVLCISSNRGDSLGAACEGEEGRAFLPKPFTNQTFLEKVEEMLGVQGLDDANDS